MERHGSVKYLPKADPAYGRGQLTHNTHTPREANYWQGSTNRQAQGGKR